jgi:putative FmdB family regulatory protein
MVIYDFECPECHNIFEEMVDMGTKEYPCPDCNTPSTRVFTKATMTLVELVPVYPGSRGRTAGGCEEANRPATKIMSGPAGCSSPRPSKVFAPA